MTGAVCVLESEGKTEASSKQPVTDIVSCREALLDQFAVLLEPAAEGRDCCAIVAIAVPLAHTAAF
jgi:hypothetical protein